MIIWINGGFGSGKTQTAFELHKRLKNSFVFDPENAGGYISRNIPKNLREYDFQNHLMWREFNATMLEHINSNFDGIIICPMTITNKEYLNEIIGNINQEDIHHFTLSVSKETLHKRLKGRGEKKGSWPFQQVDRCIEALSDPAFKEHIQTDDMSIDDVVDSIAKRCNLNLSEDTRSKSKKKIDRLIVWKKHFRILNIFR